jgi:hypothetical protein
LNEKNIAAKNSTKAAENTMIFVVPVNQFIDYHPRYFKIE